MCSMWTITSALAARHRLRRGESHVEPTHCTCDELLTGPTLAIDEDGRRRALQAPNTAEDLLDRRALPDKARDPPTSRLFV